MKLKGTSMFKTASLVVLLMSLHFQASAGNYWKVTVSELQTGPSERLEVKVPIGTCYSKLMQRLDKRAVNLAHFEHACVQKVGKRGVVITGVIFDEDSCSMVPFKSLTTKDSVDGVTFGPVDRPYRLDAEMVISD